MESSNNNPVHHKCDVCIRIKPLGAGAGDIVHEDEKYGNWRFHGYDRDKNQIHFGDADPKKKQSTYNFPKFVADDSYNQEMVYDQLLKDHMTHFLNGYNVNFMTYGQTGTGKTYTLLGPAGSLKGCDGSNLPDNSGILPRLARDIL
jgi:hypothetical protein